MIFESHITVEGVSLTRFKAMCRHAKVKPVHIVQDTGSGVDQLMSAHFHQLHTAANAIVEAEELGRLFSPNTIRVKVEWIPRDGEEAPCEVLYEEWHFKFEVPKNVIETFVASVAAEGLKTSLNTVRQPDSPEHAYVFATSRDRAQAEAFRERRKASPLHGERLVNSLHECVIYDTKPELDRFWYCDGCLLKKG